MKDIRGMSILITGGGSGLGAGMARRYTALGARVTICGRREEKISAVAESIGEACLAVRADITQAADRTRLVEAMSSRPAEILGLEAGRLAPGAPADFALIDLNLTWTVEEDTLRSRAKNSPFEHRTLEGRAVETIVAGESVYAYPRGH